jgi:hypothetical protein
MKEKEKQVGAKIPAYKIKNDGSVFFPAPSNMN